MPFERQTSLVSLREEPQANSCGRPPAVLVVPRARRSIVIRAEAGRPKVMLLVRLPLAAPLEGVISRWQGCST
jgi:hypothetical protein